MIMIRIMIILTTAIIRPRIFIFILLLVMMKA